MAVLLRGEQRGAAGGVLGGAAAPRRGAREHQRLHLLAGVAHQQLRRRADQPVHRERVALGVALGQPAQQHAGVDVPLGDGRQVAGEHDLVEHAVRLDPPYGLRDPVLPLGRRQRPVGVADAAGLLRRGGQVEGAAADRGEPGLAAAAGEHHAGDDQHGPRGVAVEGEGAEGDRSRARHADLILDERPGEQRGEPAAGPVESARAGRNRGPRRLSPAHEPLAVSDPGVRRGVWQTRQQIVRVAHRDRANHEGPDKSDTHPTHSTHDLNVFDKSPPCDAGSTVSSRDRNLVMEGSTSLVAIERTSTRSLPLISRRCP